MEIVVALAIVLAGIALALWQRKRMRPGEIPDIRVRTRGLRLSRLERYYHNVANIGRHRFPMNAQTRRRYARMRRYIAKYEAEVMRPARELMYFMNWKKRDGRNRNSELEAELESDLRADYAR